MSSFKKLSTNGDILNTGLWSYSRNPNKFFEIIFWFGLAIIGINNHWAELMGFFGPLFLWLKMILFTIPLTENHMEKNRGEGFKKHVEATNKFIPLPIFVDKKSMA